MQAGQRKVKRTAGAWNPGDPPRYFIAGETLKPYINRGCVWQLKAINDFGEDADAELDLMEQDGVHLLIDSGIFWLATRHAEANGMTMDQALATPPEKIDNFDWLRERYLNVCKRYGDRVWGYIEMDQGGAINKRRIRASLEAEGLRPIPVYHPLVDGWEYFDELAEQYDRICVGNIVMAAPEVRKRILWTIWERKRRDYPDLWIHALGLTPNELSLSLPMSSCDSSTWMAGVRWADAFATRCAARNFSKMSRDFYYDIGTAQTSEAGGHKAKGLYAWESSMLGNNLDSFATDQFESIGFAWNGSTVSEEI